VASSEAERRIADGTAWRDFCRALEQAGEAILRPGTPESAFDRAEGVRYLTRLLRAGLESFVESADPNHPRFFQLSNETIKIGNDNPDNIYHNANVSGAHEYRITGQRGTVPYLTFGSKGGGYEKDGTMVPTGQLDLDVSRCAPDGSFQIIASRESRPGNWLPLAAHSTQIVVRQTFENREKEEPARYAIECLDPAASDTLCAEAVEPALQRAAGFVKGTANLFVDWMERFREHSNELPANDQEMCQRAGGDANIYYHNSHWRLGPGEALLVEATPPECVTWNLQIGNYWMESLDYRYHRIHVNKFTAAYEADGSVRIVLAHRDPGPRWPNWLETCDHQQGAMLFRYVGASEHPPIASRVVRFDELDRIREGDS
jgi:hypothetical protein